MKEKAWSWIDENREMVIELSDEIWDYAELGLVEERSSRLIAEELERQDFRVELGVAGMPTAIAAAWGEGRPVIGIMGEYDALPGISQRRTPWWRGRRATDAATTSTEPQEWLQP
jgi:aminobenzoyl-glutamate utilization protein B